MHNMLVDYLTHAIVTMRNVLCTNPRVASGTRPSLYNNYCCYATTTVVLQYTRLLCTYPRVDIQRLVFAILATESCTWNVKPASVLQISVVFVDTVLKSRLSWSRYASTKQTMLTKLPTSLTMCII